MDIRQTGKKALKKVLTHQKNIDIIESHINKSCSNLEEEEEYIKQYNSFIYQVIGDILKKVPLKNILATIKNKELGWEHECFKEYKTIMEEQDDFIENPFEVIEGCMECQKCKSKRVFYYQKQSRSCDEGFNTYASCCNCDSKWTIKG